ncbi:MAG: hypothetical protein ACLS36_03265 [Streptococcus sp.]
MEITFMAYNGPFLGMCGEKTASPSIKFYLKNGVLDYQFYVDFEAPYDNEGL